MLSSPQLTSEAVDLDELRIRLRKMTDADLIAFGNAAQYMCSPQSQPGETSAAAVCDSTAGSASRVAATEGHVREVPDHDTQLRAAVELMR